MILIESLKQAIERALNHQIGNIGLNVYVDVPNQSFIISDEQGELYKESFRQTEKEFYSFMVMKGIPYRDMVNVDFSEFIVYTIKERLTKREKDQRNYLRNPVN